jgi:hypothetical protein
MVNNCEAIEFLRLRGATYLRLPDGSGQCQQFIPYILSLNWNAGTLKYNSMPTHRQIGTCVL